MHFKLLGNVAYKQLPEIYAAADVFLLTSHYEGNPRVVMEAMWAGVPFVSSACTGVIDSIQDGQNGYVVNSGDHNVFLERVLNLLESKDLSQKISSAALQYAQVHLNRDFLSKQWVDTWVSVCRNQSNE
jgi:glycosyltransferase involved in cell wall biosynthesis